MDMAALRGNLVKLNAGWAKYPASSDVNNCCSCCVIRHLSLCAHAATKSVSDNQGELSPIITRFAAKQRLSAHTKDDDHIRVICNGWAVGYHRAHGEDRQITSVLLSGSMPTTLSLMVPGASPAVEMVTDVTMRLFERKRLHAALAQDNSRFSLFVLLFQEERQQLLQLILDLGRRTPMSRIARLVISLSKRLAKRGLIDGKSFLFPLRQHQIADIAGITTVHACRLIRKMEQLNLFKIEDHRLHIIDSDALSELADATTEKRSFASLCDN
jgi:CRP/FNR family transcriptional regulator